METILLVINIILAVILVLLVLVQKSEGGALGIGVSQEKMHLILKFIVVQWIKPDSYR